MRSLRLVYPLSNRNQSNVLPFSSLVSSDSSDYEVDIGLEDVGDSCADSCALGESCDLGGSGVGICSGGKSDSLSSSVSNSP